MGRLIWLCLIWLCLAVPARAAGHLVILTEDWPPVTFASAGKADGMAVAVVRAIQQRIGSTDPILVQPFARGYSQLLSNPNVLLFTVGRSPERERLMTLVGPIVVSNIEAYCRQGNAARYRAMGADMFKLHTGAYRSSIFLTTARQAGFNVTDDVATPEAVANMLLNGRVDIWVDGSVIVPQVMKTIGHDYSEIEPLTILQRLELFLAFSAGTPAETIAAWQEGFRQVKQDGTFARIYKKWLPHETVPMELKTIGLPPGSLPVTVRPGD
ncbi:ABC transporter substrate-binding protein [Paludibacterium sp. B53371]|uniref:substrate-binding periplasmic protein n=1 Tax=Paludibacterium sp. B53371 TaxID=2806263 RepID=UPI001C05AEE1|nr:ABC transporter substrate-binding protein [Paludibacterium sp. B53371]